MYKRFSMMVLVTILSSKAGFAVASPLPNGGSVTGSITSSSPQQTWTFDGLTGDRVWLRMADVSGALDPEMVLLDPNGDTVTFNRDSSVAEITDRSLPLNGTYTVVVLDSTINGENFGPYELFFAKPNGAQELGGLANGASFTDQIDLGDIDSFTFYGNTGERVWLRMADINGGDPNLPGDIGPQMYLYSPTGARVSFDREFSVAALTDIALPLEGTYTVIVSDSNIGGNDDTGPYRIYFAKAPGAQEHGGLVNGGSVTQQIDLGDVDSYAFYGSTGDRVFIQMTDLNGADPNLPGDIDPELYLYDPTGARVTFDRDLSEAEINNFRLPLNGTYTVIVGDSSVGDNDDIGPYSLAFANTGGTGSPSVSSIQAPSGSGFARRPAVSWEAVAYSTWYQIWIQDLSGTLLFEDWYRASEANCIGTSNDCSLVLPTTIAGDALIWVRPWNYTGGAGPWSSSVAFSTVAGSPVASSPLAPIGSSGSRTPVYEWARVSNATWYRIWVDDATGGRIRQWVNAGEAGCAVTGQVCSYRFPSSVSGATRWWVRSWNSDGVGPWSGPADFVF